MSTTKDIKDYLHLYLGCDVLHQNKNGDFVLQLIGIEEDEVNCMHTSPNGSYAYWRFEANQIKPILRTLNSITEEEKMECDTQIHKYEHQLYSSITDWAYRIDWLLKHRFDIFNLIEEGLAIKCNKAKKESERTSE